MPGSRSSTDPEHKSPRESGEDSEDESEILEESPCGRWLKRREEVHVGSNSYNCAISCFLLSLAYNWPTIPNSTEVEMLLYYQTVFRSKPVFSAAYRELKDVIKILENVLFPHISFRCFQTWFSTSFICYGSDLLGTMLGTIIMDFNCLDTSVDVKM